MYYGLTKLFKNKTLSSFASPFRLQVFANGIRLICALETNNVLKGFSFGRGP